MDTKQDLKGFYRENKSLVKEYIDLRFRLFRLQGMRLAAKALAIFALVMILTVMSVFTLIFLGLGFSAWMAELTGSVALGHLITAALLMLVMFLALVFRKSLFLNPLIRLFIGAAEEDKKTID
jgi:hypothetical protein